MRPQDLYTQIPLTPFEEIHQKPDIKFGEPAYPDEEGIGYMPFSWREDGVPVCVDPFRFQLARAYFIAKIFADIGDRVAQGVWTREEVLNRVLPSFSNLWIRASKTSLVPRTGWVFQHYGLDPNKIWYDDKFRFFLQRLRSGMIDEDDNKLGYVELNVKRDEEEEKEKVQDFWQPASLPSASKSDHIAQMVNMNKDETVRNAKAKNWFFKEDAETQARLDEKKLVEKRMKMWLDTEWFGIKYFTIRDFMLDKYVLGALGGKKQITGPMQNANIIMRLLVDGFNFPQDTKHDNKDHWYSSDARTGETPFLHHLMWAFFGKDSNIKGADLSQLDNDNQVRSAFGQSLLEYFIYKVFPQWNVVEKALADDATFHSKITEKKMSSALLALAQLFTSSSILEFLFNQLRFPNAEITLIGPSNARTGENLEKLRLAYASAGLTYGKQKQENLNKWKGLWNDASKLKDEDLERNLQMIQKELGKAKYEAKYTYNTDYAEQIEKIFLALQQEYDNRHAHKGSKIVKANGKVQKVLEPPKDMKQIEEERRKREAEERKKAAEEEKKRQEEEKKRLAEEAERLERVKVAEAEAKAMEEIRKQEQNYENILNKMVATPDKVTDKELNSLGKEVENLKQEAENRISQLPREEREMKLALLRGDKVSEKTFAEIKETACGLQGSLQAYMEEVNKIPVGSLLAVEQASGGSPMQVPMADTDSVDMGDA